MIDLKNDAITFHDCFQYDPGYESLLLNSDIEKVLEGTPMVSKPKELLEYFKPGDLLFIRTTEKRLKNMGILAQYVTLPMALLLQRSLYNSVKLVLDDNQVIGYGISNSVNGVLDAMEKNKFQVRKLSALVSELGTALVMRHVKMTPAKFKNVKREAMKRKNIPYNLKDLSLATNYHLLGLRSSSAEVPEDKLKEYTEPMVCSSIIALIFKLAKIPIEVNDIPIKYIWPPDLVLSKSTVPVVRLVKS